MNQLTKNLSHLMNNRNKLPSGAFAELMEKIIPSSLKIDWELGVLPTDHNVDVLSLSADSDEILTDLKSQISFPIAGDSWQIILGVPPRDWELYFETSCELGKVYKIEASKWHWSAEWTDFNVKLKIYVNDADLLKSPIIHSAIHIVLVGELGEINILQYVSQLEHERISNSKQEMRPMIELRKEFATHFPACSYSDFLSRD